MSAIDRFLQQAQQMEEGGSLPPIQEPEATEERIASTGGILGFDPGQLQKEVAIPDQQGRAPASAPVSAMDAFLKEAQQVESANMLGLDEEALRKLRTGEGDPQAALETIAAAGEYIDRYSGAPTRAGIRASIRGENPLSAFYRQLGSPTETAPTGKQIAEEDLGLSIKDISLPVKPLGGTLGFDPDVLRREVEGKLPKKYPEIEFSPAGAAGLGIDIFGDVLAWMPVGKVLKGVGHYGKEITKGAVKGSAAALDYALDTDILRRTGKAVDKTIDHVGESFANVFKPTVAKDYDEMVRVAKENNIDVELLPGSTEFGKGSTIDVLERGKRELGGKELRNYNKVVEQTTEALENKIKEIGKADEVLDATEAGLQLRQAYDEGVERFFNSIETSYTDIARQNPGLKLTKDAQKRLNKILDDIESFAKERVELKTDPVLVSQGRRLLTNVNNIRQAAGDLKQVSKIMKQIGEISYKTKNTMATIPADTKKMRDIYRGLHKAFVETVENGAGAIRKPINMSDGVPLDLLEQTGLARNRTVKKMFKNKAITYQDLQDLKPYLNNRNNKHIDDLLRIRSKGHVIAGQDLAKMLRSNNDKMIEFFADKDVLLTLGNQKLSGEEIFRNLVTRGNSKKIEALKNIISPEAFNKMKASYLQDVIKVGVKENVLFGSMIKDMKNKKHIVNKLLRPEEIKGYTDILKLGDSVGIPVLSTSGTGPSLKLSKIKELMLEVTTNDMLVEYLKNFARTERQIKTIERITKNTPFNEAKAIIKRAKLPKRIERAAINRLRKIPLKRPKPLIKAPQVISVQERNKELEGR